MPERREWHAVATRSLRDVRTLCRALLDRRLEPSAVIALAEADSCAAYVLFEGFGPGVESQGKKLREVARDLFGGDVSRVDAQGGVDATALAEGARTYGNVRLRISTPPAFVPSLEHDILAPLRSAYQECRVVLYPTVGATFIGGFPRDGDRFVSALEGARAAAEAVGGNLVVVECADPSLRERIDVFGALPDSFPIMRRLKERFDPERRLNPGRFLGGL
jgi:glycolate oxidase FAD binding subunit